jgi:hypothetical protein
MCVLCVQGNVVDMRVEVACEDDMVVSLTEPQFLLLVSTGKALLQDAVRVLFPDVLGAVAHRGDASSSSSSSASRSRPSTVDSGDIDASGAELLLEALQCSGVLGAGFKARRPTAVLQAGSSGAVLLEASVASLDAWLMHRRLATTVRRRGLLCTHQRPPCSLSCRCAVCRRFTAR